VNGPIHQGDLKAVIEFVNKLPYVNPENVGVLTRSFGVTIGTGALARYPELKVKYLLDIEGPSGPPRDIMGGIERRKPWAIKRFARNRPDIIAEDIVLHGHKLGEKDFWKDRQAINFIGKIRCPYQRIQCDIDHVQDRNKRHAIDLINAATNGASPWTRMNDNPPNVIYDYKDASKYHWFPGIWKERRGTCDAIRKLLKELVDR
jgi:hypothetical protein